MKTACHGTAELRQLVAETIGRESAPSWRYDLSRCVPMFVLLLDESHDRPIDSIADNVRDIIVNQCMTGAGYAIHDQVTLEHHVKLVLVTLDRARRHELSEGEWDATPIPPQMFG